MTQQEYWIFTADNYNKISKSCKTIIKNIDEFEDIYHQVILDVFENLDKYDETKGTLTQYIISYIYQAKKDLYKDTKIDACDEMHMYATTKEPDDFERLVDTCLLDFYMNNVNFTDIERKYLEYRLSGYSNAEINEALGITNARTICHRAITKIRRLSKQEDIC